MCASGPKNGVKSIGICDRLYQEAQNERELWTEKKKKQCIAIKRKTEQRERERKANSYRQMEMDNQKEKWCVAVFWVCVLTTCAKNKFKMNKTILKIKKKNCR